jgi:hypothetical protein
MRKENEKSRIPTFYQNGNTGKVGKDRKGMKMIEKEMSVTVFVWKFGKLEKGMKNKITT